MKNIDYPKFESVQGLYKEIKNMEALRIRGIFDLDVDWYSKNPSAILSRNRNSKAPEDIIQLTREEEFELIDFIRQFVDKKIENKKQEIEKILNR